LLGSAIVLGAPPFTFALVTVMFVPLSAMPRFVAKLNDDVICSVLLPSTVMSVIGDTGAAALFAALLLLAVFAAALAAALSIAGVVAGLDAAGLAAMASELAGCPIRRAPTGTSPRRPRDPLPCARCLVVGLLPGPPGAPRRSWGGHPRGGPPRRPFRGGVAAGGARLVVPPAPLRPPRRPFAVTTKALTARLGFDHPSSYIQGSLFRSWPLLTFSNPPNPCTTPPRICSSTSCGLMMVPQSSTTQCLSSLTKPVSVSTSSHEA